MSATRRRRQNISGSAFADGPASSSEAEQPPAPPVVVEAEEFVFEEAQSADANELPLRAADLPAPLIIDRSALNDEMLRERVSAVAEVKVDPDESEAQVSDNDFEALLAKLSPDEGTEAAVEIEELVIEEAEPDDDDGFEIADEFESEGNEDDGLGSAEVLAKNLPLDVDSDFWAKLESIPDDDVLAEGPVFDVEEAGAAEAKEEEEEREPAPIDEELIERVRRTHKADLALEDESWSDEDVPLEVDDEQAQDKGWRVPVHVAARQAAFSGDASVPLIASGFKSDTDELSHALAAFAELHPGQKAFIRLSLRAYPEFKGESRAWLAARKQGQESHRVEKKPHHHVLAWVKYFFAWTWFEANKTSPHALGGRVPPTPPGQRGNAKPLTPGQVGAEEAQAWKDAEKKAMATPHYEVAMRVGVVGKHDDVEQLERVAEEVTAGFNAYETVHQAVVWGPADPYDTTIGCMGLKRPSAVAVALSADELGELARVPDDMTAPQGVQIKRSYFKQLPLINPHLIDDPYNPVDGWIPLGITNPHSEDQAVFGMRVQELDKHMFYVGATGTGKSELMKWLVFGVAKSDYPLVVIDPHGALCDDLLNMLVRNCPERANDIIVCDLSNGDFPVALNPLDVQTEEEIEPTVQSIMEMLAKNMNLGTSAPRAVSYAQQALNALCEANLAIKDPDTKCTLLHVVRFFIDRDFRHLVMQLCENVTVKEMFDPENGPYEAMTDKQQSEHMQPLLRAFQPLGTSQSFSAVFSSARNQLDFGELISKKKIVLVKLAQFSHQKKIGEFVGSLILPWLLSSMDDWGRKKDAESGEFSGRGCRVFIDEAQTLIGPGSSAIELLAGARKWDLGLISTSQYPSQFDKSVLEALLANTNSKICLKLDPSESLPLAKSIAGVGGKVSPGDIADLPNFHYYANIMLPTFESGANGAASSGAFSAACLPPIACELDDELKALRQKVLDRSHNAVCNRKEDAVNRIQQLEDIKAAIGQLLIEHQDSAEAATGGEYAISLEPLDSKTEFGGW